MSIRPMDRAVRTGEVSSVVRGGFPDGQRKFRVAIVGGGITGLSAAWYLQKQMGEARIDLEVVVLEGSNRWGGKIRTEHVDGFGADPFVIEGGPDSFLTQKPWALQLARELGLGERLLGTNDHLRKTFVLSKGKPVPLPDGVMLIVPTRLIPFALSPLLSLAGKLRMGVELLVPAKRDGKDETIADFITRRLGTEALDKIAEPLMSGIYNAEAERQSLLATFPRFRELEEKHGSLIRGMLMAQRASRSHQGTERGGSPSMFVSLQAGTQELIEALVSKASAGLRLNTAVTGVTQEDKTYRLALSDGTSVVADAVIVTSPAYAAADLLRPLSPSAAEGLSTIRYVSTGTLSMAFRAGEIDHPLDGFGLVIPRSEGRPINAITWTSSKFNHRAPAGYVLLRVFFGGSRYPGMLEKTDVELVAIAQSELAALLGIRAQPILHRIYRWHEANPQYDVGHSQRIDAIEAALPAGIYVAGSAYRGIGIPDCVHQAQQIAERLLETIKARQQGTQALPHPEPYL